MPKQVPTQFADSPPMNPLKGLEYLSTTRETDHFKEEEGKSSEGRQSEKEEFGSIMTAASALASLLAKTNCTAEQTRKTESPMSNASQSAAPVVVPKGRPRATPFPQKLMQVLAKEEYAEIMAWLPHGEAFEILSPKKLVAEVLPKNFKQAKYSSFTRKLHRWGFQRKLRGPETGAFYHDLFKRGQEDLCTKMSCYQAKPEEPLERQTTPTSPKPSILSASHNPFTPRQTLQPMRLSRELPDFTIGADVTGTLDLLHHAKLETFRRLKERADAANQSRRALSMLRFSQSPPINPTSNSTILPGPSGQLRLTDPTQQSLLTPSNARDTTVALSSSLRTATQRLKAQHERDLIDLSLTLAMSRPQATSQLALRSVLSAAADLTAPPPPPVAGFVPSDLFPSPTDTELVSNALRVIQQQEVSSSRYNELRLAKSLVLSLQNISKNTNVPESA